MSSKRPLIQALASRQFAIVYAYVDNVKGNLCIERIQVPADKIFIDASDTDDFTKTELYYSLVDNVLLSNIPLKLDIGDSVTFPQNRDEAYGDAILIRVE